METATFETRTIEEVIEKVIDYRGKTPPKTKDGIKLITAKVIKDGWIVEGNHEYIAEDTYKSWMTRGFPKKGDVLITTEAPLGEVAQLRTSEKVALAQRVILLRGKQNVISQEYLLYVLKTAFVQKQLYERSASTTVLGIKQSELLQVKLPYFPLAEQKRIAAVLEKCDRLRRTRRYALQLSDTFLQSVFLQMFGDPVTNPIGWDIQSLDDFILDTKNGISRRRKTFDNVGTIVLRIKDVGWGVIDYSEPNRIDLSEEENKNYCLYDNDLLLVRVNGNPDLVGRCAVFKNIDEPVAFNDHIIRTRLNHKVVNPLYVVHLLNSPYGRHQFKGCIITTAGQFTINRTGISNIVVPVPPLPLQEKFAQIVQKFERFRTQQREAERQAEHLFQTLLHRAFRGELISSDFDDEAVSALSKEIGVKQAKPKSTGDVSEYIHTKISQQETEAVQLTLPGLEWIEE